MRICCDIDGVLADVRKYVDEYLPHDWKTYFEHTLEFEPIQNIAYLLDAFCSFDHVGDELIFVTGRPESNKDDTKWWLLKTMPFDTSLYDLYMRPNDDHRSTHEIKMEWFRELKPGLIIDDDPKVAKAATREGFIVLQVHGFRATKNDSVPQIWV